MQRMLWVCLLVFGLFVGWAVLIGADFYVVPVKGQVTSWDKKISGATRFTLVLDGDAVLDRETGLVQEKSPSTTSLSLIYACSDCYSKQVGGRKGWRPPTVEELASLVDMVGDKSGKKLPSGHPFTNVQQFNGYWSSTTYVGGPGYAQNVHFGGGLHLFNNTQGRFFWGTKEK